MFQEALSVGSNIEDRGVIFHVDHDSVIDDFANVENGIRTGWKEIDDVWPYGKRELPSINDDFPMHGNLGFLH
jgi:hypothetical protein